MRPPCERATGSCRAAARRPATPRPSDDRLAPAARAAAATWREIERLVPRRRRRPRSRRDQRLRAPAALAGRDLVVFVLEAAARPEQHALDRRAREVRCGWRSPRRRGPRAPSGPDLVLRRRQAAERLRKRVACPRAARPPRAWLAVACEMRPSSCGVKSSESIETSCGAPLPAELVDAGVLGDLVDPGLEGDLAVGRPQAAQRGDEGLLDDVLGAAVVGDDAAHVGGDPVAVAPEERLERLVAACAGGGDELLVRRSR